jgi:hypothetical protein
MQRALHAYLHFVDLAIEADIESALHFLVNHALHPGVHRCCIITEDLSPASAGRRVDARSPYMQLAVVSTTSSPTLGWNCVLLKLPEVLPVLLVKLVLVDAGEADSWLNPSRLNGTASFAVTFLEAILLFSTLDKLDVIICTLSTREQHFF